MRRELELEWRLRPGQRLAPFKLLFTTMLQVSPFPALLLSCPLTRPRRYLAR